MIRYLFLAVQVVTVIGTLAGIAYYILCLWSARQYLAYQATVRDSANTSHRLPVSILKPLKGVDPSIYESFRSHCLQEYPDYEIIFGVSEADDPAIAVVERLQREFPARRIQLVVCQQRLGTNVKVSNLVQMLPHAQYELLIVNDSDIRVAPDYLDRVLAPLAQSSVGMVTCLYRGVPEETPGSQLESLGISTDFAAGVLVARCLEGVRFGLGSTLAFRRADLSRIGGFEALLDYLADDYQLGKRIAALGLEVRLSEVVVDTFLPAYNFAAFFEHQLRWARSVRDSRRWGYVGMLLTYGLPWALLTCMIARGSRWSIVLLAVAAALRIAVALVVGRSALRDHFVLRLLPWLLVRDLTGVLVWFASFASDTIAWRGRYFHLHNGKLSPADS
jgi:ceramide glucosyltransferase